MPDLIMITGPQAVGKMTVGQELAKLTNFKLFHNHMSIDLVNNFFSYSTKEGQDMVKMLRINMFKYFSESSILGIIFTCVVNYDKLSDIENISLFKSIFESNGGKFYYVELNAPLDIRLNRNITENRLFYKPEKQNIEFSEKQIFHAEKNHRNYSLENELNCQNYIKIDNSELSAIDTAKIIKEKFNLN
jgi:conserved hypothetical protein